MILKIMHKTDYRNKLRNRYIHCTLSAFCLYTQMLQDAIYERIQLNYQFLLHIQVFYENNTNSLYLNMLLTITFTII